MIAQRTTHLLFAVLVTALLLALLHQWINLRSHQTLNETLQKIPATLTDRDDLQFDDSHTRKPEVQLAIANALSNGNNLEQAEVLYNQVIENQGNSSLGQSARFNLANAYLRQGMNPDEQTARTRPLLEIAKQRYRDLLREAPNHWGARYNLERALRLAPELIAHTDQSKNDPIKRVRVIVPGFEKQDLP